MKQNAFFIVLEEQSFGEKLNIEKIVAASYKFWYCEK